MLEVVPRPTIARWLLVLAGAASGCSVLNAPEDNRPESKACDAGSDECAAEPQCEERCDPAASCELRPGGLRCVCPQGYVDSAGDGTRCEPRMNCGDQLECGANEVCAMSAGQAVCVCAQGYEL